MEIVKDSILIGYIVRSEVDRTFMASIINFMSHDARKDIGGRQLVIGLADQPGLYLEDNANNLIRKIMPAPWEWFLKIDTDISFPPEVPYMLLDFAKSKPAKIVSALYFGLLGNGAVKPIWFIPGSHGAVKNIGNIVMGESYPLASAGMGCCLIHRSVFETFLTVPEYANDSWTWFGRDQYWTPDTLHMGEDVSFCQRAAKLGIQTWGVSSAICTHAKRFEIGFEEFRILYEADYRGVRGEK